MRAAPFLNPGDWRGAILVADQHRIGASVRPAYGLRLARFKAPPACRAGPIGAKDARLMTGYGPGRGGVSDAAL